MLSYAGDSKGGLGLLGCLIIWVADTKNLLLIVGKLRNLVNAVYIQSV